MAPRLLTCARCGHAWQPFLERRLPVRCPKCHSYHWRKPGPGGYKFRTKRTQRTNGVSNQGGER